MRTVYDRAWATTYLKKNVKCNATKDEGGNHEKCNEGMNALG